MTGDISDREKEKWMASAEVREWTRGNKPQQPEEVHSHVGLVGDDRVRDLLSTLAQHYDPDVAAELAGEEIEAADMPPRIEQTQLYRMLLQREGTETLTRAIHQGETQTQSFAVGDPAAQSDISGIGAIQELTDMLTTSAPIFYIFGEPGSGKTNFALLLAQLWAREHPDGELGSNIRTWEEADEWHPSYGHLRRWLDEQTKELPEGGITRREDANPRLFVFDEASSHASGRGKAGAEAGKKLGPLVYKIRKANAGLIIIGHDGKDVHPAVRMLATVVQRNRGELKRADLYEDVKDREGRGKIVSLTGIPQTDYTYDDGEATSWSWDDLEDADDQQLTREQAQELAEDMHEQHLRRLAYTLATADWVEMTQREIGQTLGLAQRGEPYSQQWVQKWKQHYEKELGSDPLELDDEDDEEAA